MSKHLTFRNQDGIEYKIIFLAPKHPKTKKPCDGLCDSPESKNPRIYIDPKLRKKRELSVVIEEILHSHEFSKTEKEVRKLAANLSKILYKLGWRKSN